jgi:hypothetical protein
MTQLELFSDFTDAEQQRWFEYLTMERERETMYEAIPTKVDHKIKTADGKCPLGLIPLRVLKGPARAFEHGAAKYAPGNYIGGTTDNGAPQRYASAALRHLSDLQGLSGLFDNLTAADRESGLPHLDHAIASLVMLRAILQDEGVLSEDPGQSDLITGANRPCGK